MFGLMEASARGARSPGARARPRVNRPGRGRESSRVGLDPRGRQTRTWKPLISGDHRRDPKPHLAAVGVEVGSEPEGSGRSARRKCLQNTESQGA